MATNYLPRLDSARAHQDLHSPRLEAQPVKVQVQGTHRRASTIQAFIGATLLTSKEAEPQSKPFEIYDNRLSGFMSRVQPSGVRSYYARFGRKRRYDALTLERHFQRGAV